jgi:hypothetical protein
VAPKNERVERFRDEISYRSGRFQSFYDQLNFQSRAARLTHTKIVNDAYVGILDVFAQSLDYFRRSSMALDQAIEEKIAEIGSTNECMQDIINRRNQLSQTTTENMRECVIRANDTMTVLLRETFLPTFLNQQRQKSTVPLLTIEALNLGNLLGYEGEILTYLEDQYRAKTSQWIFAMRTLINWEERKFAVESDFYRDEMITCTDGQASRYLIDAATLQYYIQTC